MWVLVGETVDEYRQGWELSVSRFSLSLDAATVWHRGRSVYGRRPLRIGAHRKLNRKEQVSMGSLYAALPRLLQFSRRPLGRSGRGSWTGICP